MAKETTHFGFERVPLEDKVRRVAGVFDSVAPKYDLMNDLMSLGIHRLWKRFAMEIGAIRPGHRVLDLASGTGDLAARLARLVGPRGEVLASDINGTMLRRGRQRLVDEGLVGNIRYVQANAEQLPFPVDYWDRITMAFGLRNVTHKEAALAAMYQTLRPGGMLLILEFSQPRLAALTPLYEAYSMKVLPWLGKAIVNDADSYRYLAESIRMHPDQETLKHMMEGVGFERCDYFSLSAGIVCLHRGYKL